MRAAPCRVRNVTPVSEGCASSRTSYNLFRVVCCDIDTHFDGGRWLMLSLDVTNACRWAVGLMRRSVCFVVQIWNPLFLKHVRGFPCVHRASHHWMVLTLRQTRAVIALIGKSRSCISSTWTRSLTLNCWYSAPWCLWSIPMFLELFHCCNWLLTAYTGRASCWIYSHKQGTMWSNAFSELIICKFLSPLTILRF